MNKTLLTTPNGERFVVLPESDYQRLLEAAEDGEDNASAGRVMANVEEGRDEFVPEAVVNRLLGEPKESRLRIWRAYRGMTLATLAEKSGISVPYLHEIETAKKRGSVDVLRKIAAALNLDLDDIA